MKFCLATPFPRFSLFMQLTFDPPEIKAEGGPSPPLCFQVGQRSYVELEWSGGRSLGTRPLCRTSKPIGLLQTVSVTVHQPSCCCSPALPCSAICSVYKQLAHLRLSVILVSILSLRTYWFLFATTLPPVPSMTLKSSSLCCTCRSCQDTVSSLNCMFCN